ncbi:phospholipase [Franconibacter daqui]|uniref:Phospholipase n=1 Tax=Franconibacter daqui TaxID=2047724 RepID=A0ABV1PQ47_9ENTR
MYNIKIVSLFYENLNPELFSMIIRPVVAGTMVMSVPESTVRSMFTRYDLLHAETGANPYQTGRNIRDLITLALDYGKLVAIDNSHRSWSPATHLFYINNQGQLKGGKGAGTFYPFNSVIDRYETMVRVYGARPPATVMPVQVVKAKAAQVAGQPTPGKDTQLLASAAQLKEMVMTKAERWQARKDLISKGGSSVFPDAQLAAKRLAANNIAVEKAKLAENIYKTTNPLQATPDVPEGWSDISNDDGLLKKFGLEKELLFDRKDSPDFLARVYQPDPNVFGSEMNPTLVFRGSRPPEFVSLSEPVKNIADWSNNGAQGLGMESDYYKRAVRMGERLYKSGQKIDIAGHSLGGGLASATSMASGKAGWTFNAAGLHSSTVEKYGGSLLGSTDNIQAYRVEGELLTKIQEVNLWEDYKMMKGHVPALIAKEELSAIMPDAAGIPHNLPGGTGGAFDRHGIGQAISCIEQQKDEDIYIIRSRL